MIETNIDQLFTNVRFQASFIEDIWLMLSMITVNAVSSIVQSVSCKSCCCLTIIKARVRSGVLSYIQSHYTNTLIVRSQWIKKAAMYSCHCLIFHMLVDCRLYTLLGVLSIYVKTICHTICLVVNGRTCMPFRAYSSELFFPLDTKQIFVSFCQISVHFPIYWDVAYACAP